MSNPSTFTVSLRCDVRVFATLVLWLKQNGVVPTTRNQVIRTALDTMVSSIADSRPELNIASTEDAYGFLEEMGLMPNAGGRARLQLAKALNVERLRGSIPQKATMEKMEVKGKQASYKDDAHEVAKLMAERQVEEAKQSEAFKSMNIVKPETPSE